MIQSPLLPHFSGCIQGRWAGTLSKGKLTVSNPATGEVLAKVSDMSGSQTAEAVEAAARAVKIGSSAAQRQAWLNGIADGLLANREELAKIITLEQGKPLRESQVEVDYAAGFFRYFATCLDHLAARNLDSRIRGAQWSVHHRPAGVAGLITPWNFPLALMAKKLSAALAADCAVVAKPAGQTPLSAIALWTVAERTGIPSGRMNLVLGRAAPIGRALCLHPAVQVISFTGSTEIGQWLLKMTAAHVKRLALELGGNAPFIVFEDANLDVAVESLIANKFRCAGQTCVCANRVYAHRAIRARLVEALAGRISKLRVGNGMDPSSDIGPLINRAGFKKVSQHVADALRRGATRVIGHSPALPHHDWGCFYPPTLLTGVRQEMLVFQEETFGPVVAVADFVSEQDAVSLANGTPYGLAAYVFTRDAERARRCAEQLHFGHLAINTGTGPIPEAPFGGMKRSGFGREGGEEGLVEFCEVQTIAAG